MPGIPGTPDSPMGGGPPPGMMGGAGEEMMAGPPADIPAGMGMEAGGLPPELIQKILMLLQQLPPELLAQLLQGTAQFPPPGVEGEMPPDLQAAIGGGQPANPAGAVGGLREAAAAKLMNEGGV